MQVLQSTLSLFQTYKTVLNTAFVHGYALQLVPRKSLVSETFDPIVKLCKVLYDCEGLIFLSFFLCQSLKLFTSVIVGFLGSWQVSDFTFSQPYKCKQFCNHMLIKQNFVKCRILFKLG